MDFFEHQERARRGTVWLIVCFVIAVVLVIFSVYAVATLIVALLKSKEVGAVYQFWIPELFAAVTASTLLIVLSGSFYKIWEIGSGGEQVALALGGREIPANTRDLGERILLNVVEEMALASGTPVPPVYLMPDEAGINAFAAGTTPQNAVIGVTRGAVDALSREQLQGVIAHEFSHILNGDMRLNIRLMGWLHGILLIALIGYSILRIVGHSGGVRTSSSSNGKSKEGGFIIAMLVSSIALIIIGYVGVFFAQLIKAAVSRQREFLADASAVQFTRNPDGIGGALMKIGGWQDHSKITSGSAEEASHMFFGSPMLSSLFATHPPLALRVQRIKPNFDGVFPPASPVRHSASEIIDTKSLAASRSQLESAAMSSLAGGSANAPAMGRSDKSSSAPIARSLDQAHAVAIAGAEKIVDDPETIVDSIGHPTLEHIQQIHGLVDQLEPAIARSARDPLGAVAIIHALLLAPDGTAVRQQQLNALNTMCDRLVLSELIRVLPAVDRLAAEQRLPVACLVLPSLHQMSPPQTLDFQNTALALIRMDNRTTLFEFAIQRFISKRLVARLQPQTSQRITNAPIAQFQSAFVIVLTSLAQTGDAQTPQAAFAAGLQALDAHGQPLKQSTMATRDQLSVASLDQALDALEWSSPKSKRSMLAAFTACVSADSHVTVHEGELLRVIADALGCPVPPII